MMHTKDFHSEIIVVIIAAVIAVFVIDLFVL